MHTTLVLPSFLLWKKNFFRHRKVKSEPHLTFLQWFLSEGAFSFKSLSTTGFVRNQIQN